MEKIIVTVSLLLSLFVFLTFTSSALAKDESEFAAYVPAQLKDFSFWLGEWTFVNTTPSQGSASTKDAPGYNRITLTFDGYGILEDFGLGKGANAFRGGSLTVAVPRTGKIRQTWIDNSGWTKVFEGQWHDDKQAMILVGPVEQGQNGAFITRLVWKNITDTDMDWRYERSVDGGSTWTAIWDIHYERVK